MWASLLGWLMSILSGDTLRRVLDIVAKRSDDQNSQRIAELQALTAEGKNMADFNKAKLRFPWFWILIAMFIVPLALWWTIVIADSIFYFPFDVADLPTPEMRAWAGDMIKWLFYVGTVTAAAKAVAR